MVVYVNVLLMVCGYETYLSSPIDFLNALFHMKRIESVCSFLGLEIVSEFTDKERLNHQRRYLQEVIELTSQGHVRSPLSPRLQDVTATDDKVAMSKTEYISAVDKFPYAACSTSPYLTYAQRWLAARNKQRIREAFEDMHLESYG